MKQIGFILIIIFAISCNKSIVWVNDKSEIASLKSRISQLQYQIDSLRNAVIINNRLLLDRTDSLSLALTKANNTIEQSNAAFTSIVVSLDSIKSQLKTTLTQITAINNTQTKTDSSISNSSNQLVALNQKYLDLLTRYNNIIILINSFPFNTISDGLVGFYPFTGNANDSSVKNNNGIIQGAILTNDRFGISNSAYSFNGLNSNISLPKPFFDGNNSITQFGFSTFININKTGDYGIWGKTLFWGEVNLQVINDNSILLFWANSNGGNTYSQIKSAANTIAPNKWYHLTVNFSNSILKLYINGVEVNSTLSYSNQGGSFISNKFVNSQINFEQDLNSNRIGVTTISGTLTNYFNGQIDDLRVYNRELNLTEITYLATH